MKLVRDILDKKLIDKEDEAMGRVDGLLMQLGEKSQPRITHIVLGGPTLWARVHPALARLARRLGQMWGPKRRDPVQIPWSHVATAGRNIKLDLDAKETGAVAWEIWLARKVIERIPGGGHEEIDDADRG